MLTPHAYCIIDTPDGAHSIPLYDIKEYMDNPLVYSSKILNIDTDTLLDYYEWLKGEPYLYCSGITIDGNRCKNIYYETPFPNNSLRAYLFNKTHKWYCHLHRGQSND
jgi:hypothetical protein